MNNNNLIDIAYGKPCRQSSLSKWSKIYKANGVTQDLENGETFGFHTDIEDTFPYLEIDLLWIYPIDSIVIYNRKEDKFLDNAKSLFIEVSQDKKNWIDLHCGLIYFSYTNPFEIPLLSQISTRYIRFSLKEKVYFHLYKIKIFTKYFSLLKVESCNYKILNKDFIFNNLIKVVVLGTSNSLLNMGYTSSLMHNNLKLIKNVSLGSSHATLIPRQLKLIENMNIDFLILDISINEQGALSVGLYNIKLSEELFLMFLSYCSKNYITPIVLLMPTIKFINTNIKLKNYSMRNMYLYLCEKYSVSFFDGYQFLDELSLKLRRTPKSFFKDSIHLNNFAAQLLGLNLSNSIQEVYKELKKSEKIKRESYNFYFFDITPYVSRLIERKTSLMRVTLAQLKEKDLIKIKIPSEHILVGFVLNMYQSYASLKISTGGEIIIKRLDSNQYSKERNLGLVSWSLVNPIVIKDNYLSLEIIPSINKEYYEKTEHCQEGSLDDNDCILELEGLIFKSNKKITSYTTCSFYKNLTSAQLVF